MRLSICHQNKISKFYYLGKIKMWEKMWAYSFDDVWKLQFASEREKKKFGSRDSHKQKTFWNNKTSTNNN